MKNKAVPCRSALLAALLIIAAICLAGCRDAVVPVEEYTWEFLSAGEIETGDVAACGPGLAETYPGAQEILLDCRVENGTITLSDQTNNRTYTGTYAQMRKYPQGVLYNLTFGQTQGYAVTGMTTYYDGSQTPTFILTVGGYTLTFYAETGAQSSAAP